MSGPLRPRKQRWRRLTGGRGSLPLSPLVGGSSLITGAAPACSRRAGRAPETPRLFHARGNMDSKGGRGYPGTGASCIVMLALMPLILPLWQAWRGWQALSRERR